MAQIDEDHKKTLRIWRSFEVRSTKNGFLIFDGTGDPEPEGSFICHGIGNVQDYMEAWADEKTKT